MKEILGLTGRILALAIILGGIQAIPDHNHDPTVALVMSGTAVLALLLIMATVLQIVWALSERNRASRSNPARATATSIDIARRQPGSSIPTGRMPQSNSIGPTARLRQAIARDARH